jgi:hypothetical protein
MNGVSAAEKAAILAHYSDIGAQAARDMRDAGDSTDEAEFRGVMAESRRSVNYHDLSDELYEVGAVITKLAREGKADKLGALIVGLFDAYADRIAQRVHFGAVYGESAVEVAARLGAE